MHWTIKLVIISFLIFMCALMPWNFFSSMRIRPYDYDKGRFQTRWEWIRNNLKGVNNWLGYVVLVFIEIYFIYFTYRLILDWLGFLDW